MSVAIFVFFVLVFKKYKSRCLYPSAAGSCSSSVVWGNPISSDPPLTFIQTFDVSSCVSDNRLVITEISIWIQYYTTLKMEVDFKVELFIPSSLNALDANDATNKIGSAQKTVLLGNNNKLGSNQPRRVKFTLLDIPLGCNTLFAMFVYPLNCNYGADPECDSTSQLKNLDLFVCSGPGPQETLFVYDQTGPDLDNTDITSTTDTSTDYRMDIDIVYYEDILCIPTMAPSKAPSVPPSQPPSREPSQSPSKSPSKTPSQSPSKEPSKSPSESPSVSSQPPSKSPSQSPSKEPSQSPSKQPSAASQPPSKQPSQSPSDAPSVPSQFPSKTPSKAPSKAPSVPSQPPSREPSRSPSKAPSKQPSATSQPPSKQPSQSPSDAPSVPSQFPSKTPSKAPSKAPSVPSQPPSREPSRSPSKAPSKSPSKQPSATSQPPSKQPSQSPSEAPSVPSQPPSQHPSKTPSQSPSKAPSKSPSESPSVSSQPPSKSPSQSPSKEPSQSPSQGPSQDPSQVPSKAPSQSPSRNPTKNPSTPSPTSPGTLNCGDTHAGDYNGIELNFTVNMPYEGDMVFDATYSVVNIDAIYAYDVVGNLLHSNTDSDTVTISGVDAGNYRFLLDAGAASSIYEIRISCSSDSPTTVPSRYPSEYPSTVPTLPPTSDPSFVPSQDPSSDPTEHPSSDPTISPTQVPSNNPTATPSNDPTNTPTITPTKAPSKEPTQVPSIDPTQTPSKAPTDDPTKGPTHAPSIDPTTTPSKAPSNDPTPNPTGTPTKAPSKDPTNNPISEDAVITNYEVKIDIICGNGDDGDECDIDPDVLNDAIETMLIAEATGVEIISSYIVKDDLIILLSVTTDPRKVLTTDEINGRIEAQIEENDDFGEAETEEKDDEFSDFEDDEDTELLEQDKYDAFMITGAMLICAVCFLTTFCYFYRKQRLIKRLLVTQASISPDSNMATTDYGMNLVWQSQELSNVPQSPGDASNPPHSRNDLPDEADSLDLPTVGHDGEVSMTEGGDLPNDDDEGESGTESAEDMYEPAGGTDNGDAVLDLMVHGVVLKTPDGPTPDGSTPCDVL
eukprot:264076_1